MVQSNQNSERFDMNIHLLFKEITNAFLHSTSLELDVQVARLEARLLITFVLNKPRYYIDAHPEQILTLEESNQIQDLVTRRLAGEPIAYLVASREFFGRNFYVNKNVLIPRPETELMIELILAEVQENKLFSVLDLGTGSGCVATTLALECPHAQIVAVDQSLQALEIAKENAKKLNASVTWLQSNWFDIFEKKPAATPVSKFNWIVSNPPYISETDPHLLVGDVRFEPRSALTSGEDGLDDLRCIIQNAKQYLQPSGKILLEHGYNQHQAVQTLLKENGFSNVMSHYDLAGIPRMTQGQFLSIKI